MAIVSDVVKWEISQEQIVSNTPYNHKSYPYGKLLQASDFV